MNILLLRQFHALNLATLNILNLDPEYCLSPAKVLLGLLFLASKKARPSTPSPRSNSDGVWFQASNISFWSHILFLRFILIKCTSFPMQPWKTCSFFQDTIKTYEYFYNTGNLFPATTPAYLCEGRDIPWLDMLSDYIDIFHIYHIIPYSTIIGNKSVSTGVWSSVLGEII